MKSKKKQKTHQIPVKSKNVPITMELLESNTKELKLAIQKNSVAISNLETNLSQKIENLESSWDRRFEDSDAKWDRRFEELDTKWDRRFEELDNKWSQKLDDLDAKWDQKIENLGSNWDQKFNDHFLRIERIVARQETLMYEQRAENRYVLDGYASLSGRLERVEKVVKEMY